MSYIYVLSNNSMLGLLKIGMTQKHPEERAAELSTTGVPSKFVLEAFWEVSNHNLRLTEKLIHRKLSKYRFRKKREFFSVSIDHAQQIISNFFKQKDEIKKRRERKHWEQQEQKQRAKSIWTLLYSINEHSIKLQDLLEGLLPAKTAIPLLTRSKLVKVVSGWKVTAVLSYRSGSNLNPILQTDNPKVYVFIAAEVKNGWFRSPSLYEGYFSVSYYLHSGEREKSNGWYKQRGFQENHDQIIEQIIEDRGFPRTLHEFFSLAGLVELEDQWLHLFGRISET